MGINGLKVQIAISMELQRALHDPSRGIRVLSSETISNFPKKINKTFIYFLTTNAHLALAWLHTLRSHVGKVTSDIGRSTVFTKQTCKESQRPLTKKVKQRCWTILKLEEKWDGVFHTTLPFWSKIHRWRTNHEWPFQHDYVMHEVVDAHHRASARQTFVVKKYIHFYLTLIPRLGSYRALWSCIEIAIWTFNPLVPIEVHYMEKNPGMFSSKTLISFCFYVSKQFY